MFDKLFRENIKTTMHWSDIQFDLFVHLWKELHTQNVTSIKKSYIYTPEYFELILIERNILNAYLKRGVF